MISYIFYGICLALAFLLYKYFIKVWLSFLYYRRQFKGRVAFLYYPLGGIVHYMHRKNILDSCDVFYKTLDQNPEADVILTHTGDRTMILYSTPELVKLLTTTNEAKHDKVIKAPLSGKYLLGECLFYARGKKWRRQRNFLGPFFQHDRLKNSIKDVETAALNALKNYEDKVQQKGKNVHGARIVNVLDLAGEITSEVIVRFFFSKDFEGQTINGRSIAEEAGTLVTEAIVSDLNWVNRTKYAIFGHRFYSGSQRKIANRALEFKNKILKLINQRENNPKASEFQDLLSSYLNQMNAAKASNQPEEIFDYEEIFMQLTLLLFAGVDTTSQMLGVSLYCLGKYEEWASLVEKEIFEVLGAGYEISTDKLGKLKVTTAFLNEVFRLYTSSHIIFYREVMETHFVGDAKIHKGDLVTTNFLGLMRSKRYFEKPEVFNPQRWLDETSSNLNNPFAFTPFSAGPRNCIGQHLAMIETKTILVLILRAYRVKLNPEVSMLMTMKFLRVPQYQNLVYFEPRTV